MDTLMYIGVAALLPPIFLVPGWLWLRRAGVPPLIAVYAGFGLGVGVAGVVVGLAVLAPWPVQTTCSGALVVIVLTSVWCWRTAPRPRLPPRAELAGVAVFLVGYASLAAFVAVPSKPFGYYGIASVPPGLIDSAR